MRSLHQPRFSRRLISVPLWCVALAFVLLVSGQEVKGEDRIWSALVLATNSDSPKKPSPEVARFSGAVQRIFGYNQVQLIGSATKTIDEQCERWLVPSQNFWMSVKAKQNQGDNYLLKVVVFHDERCLVEAEAKLKEGSPLFIRGPMYGRGQLLILLQVQP